MRTTVSALCLALLVTPLAAQEPAVGLYTGPVFGGLTGAGVRSYRPGLTIGPTFTFRLSRWLGLETGLAYQAFSVGWMDPTPAAASFRQMSVPMVARVDLGANLVGPTRLTLRGGLQADYTVSCRVTVGNGLCGAANVLTPVSEVGRFQLSPLAGVGIAADLFDAVRLGAEVRYARGSSYRSYLGDLRRESWSIAFSLAGLGWGPRGASLEAPAQRALPNHQAPHPTGIQ